MSRFSEHDLAEIRARNPVAEIAARYVELRRSGGRLSGPCPICGGGRGSQRFEVKADGESWVCAVCTDGGDVIRLVEKVEGCSFTDACERLGGRASADPEAIARLAAEREAKRAKRDADAAAFREAERRRLWKIWRAALPIARTPAARYLEGRGLIVPDDCPGLRYMPAAAYFHGQAEDERGKMSAAVLHRGPAMVAAFIRADGTFGGLHTTWLTERDPPSKLQLSDPQTGELLPAKKMRGSKTGAHILVARGPGDLRQLVIGEGIETAASVFTALVGAGRPIDGMQFWAAGDLGNLAGRATQTIAHPSLKRPDGRPQRVPGPMPDPDDPGLAIPDSVEDLLLLGDGDSEPLLTHCAMERAARRYARPGRTIRPVFAPIGVDLNNVLQGME